MHTNTAPNPHRLRVVRPDEDPPPRDPPRPDYAIVNWIPGIDGEISLVSRYWPEKASYCGRCPREACTVIENMCAVPVAGHVELEEVFDLHLVPAGSADRPSRPAKRRGKPRGAG